MFNRSIRLSQRLVLNGTPRNPAPPTFATGRLTIQQRMSSSPQINQTGSIDTSLRNSPVHMHPQSSASKEEHKTGKDHPAKQPDPSNEPSRSTGIMSPKDDKGKGGKGKGAEEKTREHVVVDMGESERKKLEHKTST